MENPFSIHPLDPGFVMAKPIQSVSDEVLLDLEARGRLRIQRKHNGHCGFATGAARLYSRTITDITAKFPYLADELRDMDLPRDTLLAGETLVEIDGVESLGTFGGLANSLPERAIRTQLERGINVQLRLYGIAAHRGEPVLHLPYDDRYDLLQELTHRHLPRNIRLVEPLSLDLATARRLSLEKQWEGLVLYDGAAGSEYRLDGRHDRVPRPEGCWKWKDYLEDDFVATGWVPSTAATRAGMVKDLKIAQYHPQTGELISCGRTSSGLELPQRREFADDAKYPFVVQIQFERRTDTGKLIAAEIMRIRDDKAPEECLFPASLL